MSEHETIWCDCEHCGYNMDYDCSRVVRIFETHVKAISNVSYRAHIQCANCSMIMSRHIPKDFYDKCSVFFKNMKGDS